jgi:hypothetical protein
MSKDRQPHLLADPDLGLHWVKVVFLNSLKSMNGASLPRSTRKKTAYATMPTAANPRTVTLVQPILEPKSKTIIRPRVPTTNSSKPTMSMDPFGPACSTLFWGMPRIITNAMTELRSRSRR